MALARHDADLAPCGDTPLGSLGYCDLLGRSYAPCVPDLLRLHAYQAYWHSWQTFHSALKPHL